jgi:hypothetical protein
MSAAALVALAKPAEAVQENTPSPSAQSAPSAPAESVIEGEARRFMHGYARDLQSGDRAAIARRYHRTGAWRVGQGAKRMDSWAEIAAYYAGKSWSPPASFEWRDLSFEVLSDDAVIVVGLFHWTPAAAAEPMIFSYTGLLLLEDGELRIRLEDESTARMR